MKAFDMDKVQEMGEYSSLVAGGYVCKITGVVDAPEKEYLKLEYDIAEGEFKDYYTRLYNAKGFWGGSFIRSYKESARGFFKAFTNAVEGSNPNYKWDFNEVKLKGKLIGLVLAHEEYKANDGTTKKRLYVSKVRRVEQIRKKDYEVPDIKKLPPQSQIPDGFHEIDNTVYDDVPF